MKVKRYATFTTESNGRRAKRTFTYWQVVGILLLLTALTFAFGWLSDYQFSQETQRLISEPMEER